MHMDSFVCCLLLLFLNFSFYLFSLLNIFHFELLDFCLKSIGDQAAQSCTSKENTKD